MNKKTLDGHEIEYLFEDEVNILINPTISWRKDCGKNYLTLSKKDLIDILEGMEGEDKKEKAQEPKIEFRGVSKEIKENAESDTELNLTLSKLSKQFCEFMGEDVDIRVMVSPKGKVLSRKDWLTFRMGDLLDAIKSNSESGEFEIVSNLSDELCSVASDLRFLENENDS